MKNKVIFRILAVAIILSLLMLALPVSPALAQPTPTISATPTSGLVGSWVSVSGINFPPALLVTIVFGTTGTMAQVTVNPSGDFSTGFFVPPTATPGINVISTTNPIATTNFTVLGVAAITVTPTSGAVGDTVTVSGVDFTPSENVTITFDNVTVTTIPASVTTDTLGNFTATFNVPAGIKGVHTVKAVAAVKNATATFTTAEKITITPETGDVGDTVTVSGAGFVASSSVAITFDNVAVTTIPASVTTGATGSFSATFNVPTNTPGVYTVKAEDADGNLAEADFTIAANPEITITPTSGLVGATVMVSGSGFSASSSVTISFDGTSVGTTSTDASGSFTTTFSVPASAKGAHTVRAQDASGNFDTGSFTTGQKMSVTPTSGLVGATVTVSGSGFSASSSVIITFDDTSVGTASTDASGSFTTSFNVPASANGAHSVKAQDSAGNFDTGSFTTGQKMSITPTSGLVGATVTVSGSGFSASSIVTITFDDTSVGTASTDASGSFTTSFNVPASANGAHSVKAQDSAGNFDTGSFTTGEEMSITPTSGLVGATVTVSGNGFSASSIVTITFDDTGVGTASTDASGNFTTTFNVPASANGAHSVKAEDASGNFGTGSFTTGQKMSITPTSGLVGSQVTVSGSGFGGSKSIDIYFDDVLVGVGVATADADGDFTGTFTIPASSGGAHTIKAQDSAGNFDTGSFTTGEEMSITPTSGVVGATVTVSGNGFSASSIVTITFDDTSVDTTSTDATGSFTTTFNVPASARGAHTVKAQDSAGNFATSTFTTGEKMSITPASGVVGEEVTVSGSGLSASSSVTITFDGTSVGTTTTDSNGSFSVAVTIPPSVGGEYAITVSDGVISEQFVFTMEQEAPPTPQPLLPLGGDKPEQPVSFDWADVTDPSLPLTYTLQIASDEDFTILVLERTGLTESEYTMTEEEKLESTKKESPYYWRVKAIDGASNESGWTGAGSFYIGGSVWPAIPAWVRYVLLGLVILVVIVVGFWLGMRRAYSSF